MTRPEELFRYAQRLSDEDDEAAHRILAHVSYYAVYHLMARHFGLDPAKRSEASHSDVCDLVEGAHLPAVPRYVREAKRVFRQLRRLRVKADYHLDVRFPCTDAVRASAFAAAVFASVRT